MVVAPQGQEDRAGWPDANEKSREVRLGLVMYGGISLAIYINGVSQEFFRAVRGRGIYRLVKALTDSDIVVDVVSGTSAGGINGVLLSYALCNGKSFANASNLWRHHGAITRLLRAPDAEIPEASSFLDSEGYYQPRLEDAFRSMGEYTPDPGEDPSVIRELDLFVTGTDIDGNVYTQFDDAGHPIDIKDHRAVFLLKHRQGRKEPFKPDGSNPQPTYQALAKLCRLTSCFPAAFSPVQVGFVKEPDGSADAKLQVWGRLAKETCFLDGGVLDNKPFTYTLKAIFSRTADREVERKLFYVEPDPEVLSQAEKAKAPNFLQAVLAALIGIPGYESIADDLRLLADRNSKLQQYHRLVWELQSGSVSPGPVSPETRRLYDRSRLVSLSERVIQGLFRKDGRNQQIPPEHRERAAFLVKEFDNLPLDAQAVLADFDLPFRMRRIFRLVYLIYDLLFSETAARAEKPLTVERARRYRELWQALNRHIKLSEVLLSAMESLVDDAPIRWEHVEKEKEKEIWHLIQAGYRRLLDDNGPAAQRIRPEDLEAFLRGERQEWLGQDDLLAIHADLVDTSRGIIDAVLTSRLAVEDNGVRTLLGRVDACERRLLEHFVPDPEDPVRRAYDSFEEMDAHLFPLEMVGNLREKDIIETIRISPKDAKRGFSAIDLPSKVAGDAVFHFGGFFKRSWRSNDILWGRLDGLCQLVETLLDRGRVAALAGSPGWRARIRDRFFEGEAWRFGLDPADLFPRSGSRTHEECRRWLSQLLGDDDQARGEALAPKRFDEMVTLLVEAAQLEVLWEDLPNVMVDAIQEQVEWNRFQMVDPKKRKSSEAPAAAKLPPWIFEAGRGHLDPLVATTEAMVRVEQAMRTFDQRDKAPSRPSQTGLGTFFRESYEVGSEKLVRDIPTLVLLEILAKALLVARTCILGLFGEEQQRIRRSPAYRFLIDWPLRAFYGLVRLSRRSPGAGLGVLLGLGALSIFALVVGIFWGDALVFPAEKLSWPGLGIFILAPVLILFVVMAIFVWISRRPEPEG